ncbi:MAG: lipopolysaccharide heptosyltransferase II [Calditrichaeota bacterium]|nr:MAG: lipopolysaccharide heptosyltransferase II [Calditrichota bacterium]
MDKYKKILIVQTAFLGDVILITPLIRAVHELIPAALIDVLIIPQTVGALKNNPHLHQVLTFDKRKNKILAFWKILKILRKNRYDLAITPHSSSTTAYLLRLAGISERLGFDRWHASKHLTLKAPHYDDRGWHKIQKNLHLLSVFTEREFSMQTELFPSREDKLQALQWLSEIKYPEKPIIALAPGSVWNTKRWPEEYYAELCRLISKHEVNLIFIGGPEEKDICDRVIQSAGITGLNFAGRTKILESAALIELCDLLICNDSGAMHIANAMKTDVMAFFGPTVPSIGYYPYREKDFIFELDMDCRPCSSHGGKKCPLKHHNCMRKINPELVYDAVKTKFSL